MNVGAFRRLAMVKGPVAINGRHAARGPAIATVSLERAATAVLGTLKACMTEEGRRCQQ